MPLILSILFSALLLNSCKEPRARIDLLEIKVLDDYPSGSASEYFEGKLMVMGDDASKLLVFDSAWQSSRLVPILNFEHPGRMSKKIKADIEGATWFRDKNESGLLMLGSGSQPPHRSKGFIVKPLADTHRSFSLDTFYNRLENAGIKQLNVEGLTQLPGWFVIGCRGNLGFKKNHLVFVKNRFWENQGEVEFHTALLGGNSATRTFSGLSGLDYSYKTDRLFITASTEHTSSTSADGQIGKSYLWIVNSMNRMVEFEAINPFDEIDLEAENPRFAGIKVESVSVVSENTDNSELILVSDNDDGKTTLFRVRLHHKNPGDAGKGKF